MTSLDQGATLFDFHPDADLQRWWIVNDGVMGGRSKGKLLMDNEGHGVFEGFVSLENNGGFTSMRYRFPRKEVKDFKELVLRVKGDGKRYQFRIKPNSYDRHSYIQYFQTTGEWQTIHIPLAEMYPTFRGRRLRMNNFNSDYIEEIAFLIANKRAERFQMLIDYIAFQ